MPSDLAPEPCLIPIETMSSMWNCICTWSGGGGGPPWVHATRQCWCACSLKCQVHFVGGNLGGGQVYLAFECYVDLASPGTFWGRGQLYPTLWADMAASGTSGTRSITSPDCPLHFPFSSFLVFSLLNWDVKGTHCRAPTLFFLLSWKHPAHWWYTNSNVNDFLTLYNIGVPATKPSLYGTYSALASVIK